jgi:competence CoiA-like predicted nuclease
VFSAIDSNNILVDIDNAAQHPDNKYFCPSCNGELVIRKGNVRVSHFAHKNICDCDGYDNDMSEWHRNWQSKFPLRNREVVLKLDENDNSVFIEQCKRKTRRADVLCYGYAIEFQNSPISSQEFIERSWFYNTLGKKVVWIFNMIDEYQSEKIKYIDEWSSRKDNGGKYSWNYASKTFIDYDSDDKDIIIIFQFHEIRKEERDIEQGYFERVTWAIDSNSDYKYTNFKRFCTSYYPANFTALMEKLKRKEL